MNSPDYQPISCELHSNYELAIMHGQKLRLSWRDDAGRNISEMVLPLDLQSRNGEEYLVVQTKGKTISIRLDHIHTSQETGK